MKRRLREPFGKAGLIVAAFALVFAMLGGAYAASNDGGGKATASAKAKQGKQGKPGKTGPAGPQGPAGPAGPAGAKGDTGAAGGNGKDGTNGTNGTDGKDGKNIETGTATVGECPNGGSWVQVTGEVATRKKACNGAPGAKGDTGDPWTAGGTLPVNSTETGSWLTTIGTTDLFEGALCCAGATMISFPVPLAAPLTEAGKVVVVDKGETPVKAACDDGVGTPASPEHPEADSGFLCVFIANAPAPLGATEGVIISRSGSAEVIAAAGASTAGAVVTIAAADEADKGKEFWGTFAVTG